MLKTQDPNHRVNQLIAVAKCSHPAMGSYDGLPNPGHRERSQGLDKSSTAHFPSASKRFVSSPAGTYFRNTRLWEREEKALK